MILNRKVKRSKEKLMHIATLKVNENIVIR